MSIKSWRRAGIALTTLVLVLATGAAGCASTGSGGSTVKHVNGPNGKYHKNVVMK
ncbi:MAG: hypothetical protein K1Y02_11425 [Candidatus Hydrogenedentes bacterium]|nr:hypothetical protein [Candidatus Hydrogenedentota bacterium]